jgi:hypothetical protein
MKPIKFTDYLAKSKVKASDHHIIDLRDYGLTNSAPKENGRAILTLRIDPRNGTLQPTTA